MFKDENDERLSYLEHDMETLSNALAELQSDFHYSKIQNLFSDVRKWGRDRGLNNLTMQYAKVNEEIGEIAREITRCNQDSDEFQDAIGDSMITLIVLADIAGYNAEDCLERAYEEVAHRKGHTEHGTFIKDSNNN